MSSKRLQIWNNSCLDAVIGHGRAQGPSERITDIADRYGEILARTPVEDKFTESEWNLLRDANNGTIWMPAASIHGGLEANASDAIALDGLDKKWEVNAKTFLAKLQFLSFVEQIAIVESIERWWAEQCPHDADNEDN